MVRIEGTTISLVRGDSLNLTVSLFMPDGDQYVPDPGDSLRFALKKSFKDAEVLIQKTIPLETMVLTIDPEDTKVLEFGRYDYDIELTTAAGLVDTVIPCSAFNILPEVY